MQNIREMLRLKELQNDKINFTQIGIAVNAHRGTVRDYITRAILLGMDYQKALLMTESELRDAFERKLTGRKTKDSEIDFLSLAKELKRKGVTVHLLWQEHLKKYPNSYRYSHFAARFNAWRRDQKISLRKEYKGGEWCFTDYSGAKMSWVEETTGEIHEVEIFVATLGASNLTYIEATATQAIADWIGAHVRALEYFGGVPQKMVPDNLLSGVTKACYYEPEINRTYAQWAAHYNTAVIPARVRKPQDKAKVEGSVLIVQRWIIATLRNKTFFSLEAINASIHTLLENYNNKKMQVYGCSRRELFNEIEKEYLQPLPPYRFEISTWKKAKVNIDYHIEYKRHYYSVPFRLRSEYVELQVKEKTVDIFHNGKQVATHLRSSRKGFHTTVKEHMPENHRFVSRDTWTPDKLINWATKIGPQTKIQVARLIESRKYPEQSFRAVLGILRLEKTYSQTRLEAACEIANSFGVVSFQYINTLLKKNLEKIAATTTASDEKPQGDLPLIHSNIRGSDSFH